jgi:hypothetical protein
LQLVYDLAAIETGSILEKIGCSNFLCPKLSLNLIATLPMQVELQQESILWPCILRTFPVFLGCLGNQAVVCFNLN